MQFYDMPWSGPRFTTCLGRDAVLRHAMVGTQVYDLPWSGCGFTTCSGQGGKDISPIALQHHKSGKSQPNSLNKSTFSDMKVQYPNLTLQYPILYLIDVHLEVLIQLLFMILQSSQIGLELK